MAQAPPPPPPPPPPPGLPIDNGILILALVGLIYGMYKAYTLSSKKT
ncbi:hypothetical protein OAE03_00750 [Winogradskyella sp.]|nr:hypothetical protein [Winogradskyella sp.]MDC0009066.1 hypothetical protein [Winogradskyella sp.]MDC1503727.1 hypothetical protein [Winogradskyella sp.]